MPKDTDVRPIDCELYFLPVETRVPLKFGPETLTEVICARVKLTVADGAGGTAEGWGETPLSVQWVWPADLSYEERCEELKGFTRDLAGVWAGFETSGHPIEVGYAFIEEALPELLGGVNGRRGAGEHMPWLAALVCCSAFDIALHDAYGIAAGVPGLFHLQLAVYEQ